MGVILLRSHRKIVTNLLLFTEEKVKTDRYKIKFKKMTKVRIMTESETDTTAPSQG